MTNVQNKWIRWTTLLLLVVSFLLTPIRSISAQTQPQQLNEFNHLPMLANNYCSGLRSSEVPLGTQLYGPTGKSQRHYTLFQNTGTPWLRNSIYWNAIEPVDVEPSQYIWGGIEALLKAVKDNCANMIVTIEGIPSWAATDGNRSPIKPANIPDFVEFMVALVERYDGDGKGDSPCGIVINHWEIFNEPDFGSQIPNNVGYGDFGAQYAQLLEAIYEPIHDASDNVQIVFGGIAYNSFINGGVGLFTRSFFKDVLAAGVMEDVLFQPTAEGTPQGGIVTIPTMLQKAPEGA